MQSTWLGYRNDKVVSLSVLFLQKRRDEKAAKRLLKRLFRKYQGEPAKVVDVKHTI